MIKDISLLDTGNYSCSVQNKHGIDSQWSVLDVKGLLLTFFSNKILLFEQNVALSECPDLLEFIFLCGLSFFCSSHPHSTVSFAFVPFIRVSFKKCIDCVSV